MQISFCEAGLARHETIPLVHIAVIWDISAQGPRWTALNSALVDALQGYSWVRPLSTFYIVKVFGEPDRTLIRQKLQAKAEGVTERIHFLVSPLMPSSRYDGYLPKDTWPLINQRTD